MTLAAILSHLLPIDHAPNVATELRVKRRMLGLQVSADPQEVASPPREDLFIGAVLLNYRAKHGISQRRFARYSGIRQSTLSDIESRKSVPKPETRRVIRATMEAWGS